MDAVRILEVTTFYRPHWTGLTVYAQNVAEGLAHRGHHVTVVCTQHDRDLPATEVLDGVHVVRAPTLGRVSRAPITAGLLLEARRQLSTHDVVVLQTPLPESGPLVALARRAGRPSVVNHHGDVVMPTGLTNRAVQAAMYATSRAAVLGCDLLIASTLDYAVHSRLLAERAGPTIEIHPPSVLPEPRPDAVAAWRRDLGLEGRAVVGFGGRFVEEKGFDRLLAAVPLIRAAVPDVHFAFAGDVDVAYEDFHGRCRPLLDLHRDVITSVGLLLDRQRLADFYAMCDVFALPSRSDCFPSMQIEALLSGTRLVTADIPGAREAVRVSGLGRIADAADPAAFAAAIADELLQPRPRPTRREVLAAFDPERSIDRYEAVLADLVAGRPVADAIPVRARTTPDPRWSAPTTQHAEVDRLLTNETDMAYRRRVPRLFELLDPQPGHTVLDGGCGMGVLAGMVARLWPVRVVATDLDGERLAWAQREGVGAGLYVSDLADLPLPDASIDRGLLAEVLEHVDDDVAALREVGRVLRPGGVVAISVPHANYPASWDALGWIRDAAGAEPSRDGFLTGQWSGHRRLYLPGALDEVIRRAGLVPETIEAQTAHAFPLTHLLVYTVGKRLIEADLLPERVRLSTDRFRSADNPDDRRDPFRLARALLHRFDRRNDDLRGDETRFVQLVARATKPAS